MQSAANYDSGVTSLASLYFTNLSKTTMTVGEIVLSAFLQVLLERLVPRDLSFFPHVLSELQKWKKKLLKMEAVLADAEDKKLTDELVKMWLDDLRDLAYDLDLLDELAHG
ncbi:hypothetical protein Ddye_011296 [Dipteronia dyeriana]|uniref:Disease resistance N-terminal domain-containing protein n=1 Tax=Dipteronia dyeriana TaxID=168575 RepID=A0AAD9X2A5_9ROSI|nr:hypothetical protein Ddye_011296 [Dipteronia dyeriana]